MRIIYLDQFALQRAFCPSPKGTNKEFFVRVGELCLELPEKKIAAFPFSESHLNETALQLDPDKRKAISEKFAAIPNGYQYCQAQGIQQLQASAVRKGLPIDWSPQWAIFRHTKLGFPQRLRGTIADDRNLHHAALKPVIVGKVMSKTK